jgi:protein-S-isoprenylcysteine O-methyltransferase Ste14
MSTSDPTLPLKVQRTPVEPILSWVITFSLTLIFILLERAFPFDPGVSPASGLPVLAAGLALAVWSWRTLRRAGTTNDGSRAATALVTHGPYRLSRNPHILGVFLSIVGVGLLLGKGWLLLLTVIIAVVARISVIPREEAHLAALFGDAWTAYAARTRRWL